MATTAQPQTLSVLLEPAISRTNFVTFIALTLTYLGLKTVFSNSLPDLLPIIWESFRLFTAIWTVITVFLASPIKNLFWLVLSTIVATISFWWGLPVTWKFCFIPVMLTIVGFRMYRALDAIVMRDHLDAGKGGTPANYWG